MHPMDVFPTRGAYPDMPVAEAAPVWVAEARRQGIDDAAVVEADEGVVHAAGARWRVRTDLTHLSVIPDGEPVVVAEWVGPREGAGYRDHVRLIRWESCPGHLWSQRRVRRVEDMVHNRHFSWDRPQHEYPGTEEDESEEDVIAFFAECEARGWTRVI